MDRLARAEPREEALIWLANAGGDTDTNAAVAGGLLGARDGEAACRRAGSRPCPSGAAPESRDPAGRGGSVSSPELAPGSIGRYIFTVHPPPVPSTGRSIAMTRRLLLLLALAATPARRPDRVDTAGAGALIGEALNHSEVMKNLEYLTDVIGPRLTGSPAMQQANDWTEAQFKPYGLTADRRRPGSTASPGSGGRSPSSIDAPFPRNLPAHSWAWTEGTGGKTLTGPGGEGGRLDAGEPGRVQGQGEGRLAHAPARRPRSGIPTARR